MEVRCERCGTSYALDDARLGEGGARVRCARCGHVFLIQRPEAGPPAAPPPAGSVQAPSVRREWKVRGRDGAVSTFHELTTLQRWIVERKLGRDDEIGLDGEHWKRLGTIPDLSPFFEVVETAARVRELEAELAGTRPHAEVASGSDLSAAVSAALEPSPVASAPEPAPPSPPAPRAPEPAPPEAAAPPAAPPAPAAAAPGASLGVSRPATPPSAPARRSAVPALAALGEPAFTRSRTALRTTTPDDWEPPRVGGGAGRWVVGILVVLLLVGAGVWAYFRIWLPEEMRAREERARAARVDQEQREKEEHLKAAEERAKQELLQALSASETRDGGPAAPDAGSPRGALDAVPPASLGAKGADSATPARAVADGATPAAGPALAAEEPAAAAAPAPERRGPPQTFEEWMAEGHRRRTHERAAGALAAYDRALALGPSRAEAHTGRALALLDLGRRNEALAEFQRALELDPRDGIAVLGMAETYRSLGRTEEARRGYQRYLDGWPGGSEARAARAALESLRE